jgi:hypothetical protein
MGFFWPHFGQSVAKPKQSFFGVILSLSLCVQTNQRHKTPHKHRDSYIAARILPIFRYCYLDAIRLWRLTSSKITPGRLSPKLQEPLIHSYRVPWLQLPLVTTVSTKQRNAAAYLLLALTMATP